MPTSSSDRRTQRPEGSTAAATPDDGTHARASPPGSARLSARGLLEAAGKMLQTSAAARSVLVVVSLHRSDRLMALAQQPASRPVMLEVLRRIQSILRPMDRYAMVSHEEIWLLLADLPSAALAELAARTLQQTLSRPISFESDGHEQTVQLRPAVGAAWMARARHADPLVLLGVAADACGQARRSEDRVSITRLESDEAIVNRNALERDLRRALQGNELEVYFQPQVELASGRCVAVEALIRWNDPSRGRVSPQLIATLCEERGMMPQLTQFVLNTTLRHQMFWKTQGVDVSAAINVAAGSLEDGTFPYQVSQALSTWSADPQRLTLELTESSIVQNERAALEFMTQLSHLGCRLAIDDFGTGYSSFAYLRQFPLNELKIDQTFVRNILKDKGDQRIVHALVDLAHTFEMRALAEGVESVGAARMLAELGCDLGQGYHFSEALPANRFVEWFNARAKAGARTPEASLP
jgi:EAL domain-containing protein (putative c-di-GMP-specific phosphodiesterase class I)/GGDEF domain-containing protein